MADDPIANTDSGASRPVFETVPIDDVHDDGDMSSGRRETLVPEEIKDDHVDPFNDGSVIEEIEEDTPEDLTVSDISGAIPSSPPPGEIPTFEDGDDGSNVKKYALIGLGVVGIIVVLIVIFSVVFGLLRGSSNKKITLEYWGLWEDPVVMKSVIEDYKRVKPNVTINYVVRETTDYRIKLITRAKEGGGPDIFRFHNTWLPSIIDVAAPMPSSVMSNSEYEQTFYPIIQSDMKYDNSYYGMALGIDGLVLLYNSELFKRAGITSAPKTWDDVVRAADKLRVEGPDGRLVTSGIALGSAKNIEHFSDIIGWMLIQNGAQLNKLSAPEAVEVLTNYRQFAEPQLNFWNSSMPSDVNAFVQKKVAMIIVPSWHILNIKKSNPELDMKVAALPILPGSEPVSLATYWAEGVSRSSKNQEAAWEFLAYLSSKETMTKLFQEQSKVRAFGVPYSRVDLRDTLIQNEYIGPVLEQAPHMKSMPMSARTFDQGLNDEIISYIRNAVNSTEEGVSYNSAFSTAENGVNQVLTKYNIQ